MEEKLDIIDIFGIMQLIMILLMKDANHGVHMHYYDAPIHLC